MKGRHSPRTRSLDTTTSTSSFDRNNFYTKLVTAHSLVIKDEAQNTLELTNNCSSDAIHFYKTKVEINKQESINLCYSTLTQMGPIWLTSRKLRITGTSAYKLFTFFRGSLQNKNICSKLNSLLFSNFSGNSATFYGVENEPLAIKAFEKLKNITVIKSGIIVNIHCPWLGFSPDGFFISDNEMYLIEIKCPVMGKTMCGLELLKSLKYIVINSIGVPSLKKKHSYYGQIQLGLLLCNIKQCYLVIYEKMTNSVLLIEVILDLEFCKKLYSSLNLIYFRHVLPFLLENQDKI